MGALLGFSLIYFIYLYFYPFKEGVSEAPAYLKSFKDILIVIFLVYGVFEIYRNLRALKNVTWLIVGLLLFLIPLLFLALSTSHLTNLLDAKNFLLGLIWGAVLYCTNYASVGKKLTAWMNIFLGIMLFQVFCSAIIIFFFPENNLWLDLDASGFLGNPNTFALFLNFGISIVLAKINLDLKPLQALNFILLSVLFTGIMLSNSLSGLLIALFLVGMSLCLFARRQLMIQAFAATITVVCTLTALEVWKPEVVQYEVHRQLVSKVTNLFFDTPVARMPDGESISFSYRRITYEEAFFDIRNNPINTLFGFLNQGHYRKYDGGWLVLLCNFGLIALLFFIAINAKALYFSFTNRNDFQTLVLGYCLTACLLTLLFSRILDYFPGNLFYWFILAILFHKREAKTNSSLLSPIQKSVDKF